MQYVVQNAIHAIADQEKIEPLLSIIPIRDQNTQDWKRHTPLRPWLQFTRELS